MRVKQVKFNVTYLERGEKPDWFLAISPHGKVPVLKADDHALYESNAIAEFLDEVVEPRLHPENPVKRARHRAWTDFVPDFSLSLGKYMYAKTREKQVGALEKASATLAKLENTIAENRENGGPYFSGNQLCLVDAAYAPFLMRFQMIEDLVQDKMLDGFPNMKAWSAALLAHDTVKHSVVEDFGDVYNANLERREAYAATLIA
jgi:glutathione S-transferase